MGKNTSEVRTQLAASTDCRVELDAAGVLHVHSGETTLELDQAACEDLATTLARAVIALSKRQAQEHAAARRPKLRLV
jgi:hypothetical protein